ncbi:MAG: hypothetical protein R3E11_01700 [Sphingobium sp.]
MVRTIIAAGERSTKVVTFAKLINVALVMLWGFAVTFVFVRAMPTNDFRVFLLLVAFNNFTISAEFGFTNVIYARLRRYWLHRTGMGEQDNDGDFRLEEVGVLFLFLCGLMICSSLLVALGIALGWIRTGFPAVLILFFLVSAFNVLLLLSKRALAALDRNLIWEAVDIARRLLALAALFAVLVGLSLLASVAIQLALNILCALFGMFLIHKRTGMRRRQWFAWRTGGRHVRDTYMRDIGSSAALTMSEVAAYNGPYFVIAAVSKDMALILLFDFCFKMIRAVATAIRATIEGALPRLTRHWFAGEMEAFGRALKRAGAMALGIALCAGLVLIAIGQRLFAFLYDGNSSFEMIEVLSLCVLLAVLSIMSVSVYLQGALGRFDKLLRCSLPFLAGSLLAAPLAAVLHAQLTAQPIDHIFMAIYTLVFVAAALLHLASINRLRQSR